MKQTLILASFFITFLQIQAQVPQLTSSEILQGLKKLNTVGSVLFVAAHPDDENTRLLTYLSKEKNLRTGYLSVTRGDGGQNLIGKEQGDLLGLIRTQELLGARRIDGAEQFFTRANDFGFSKNPEETFRFWNKDSVLADMVWVIRNFRPDVIICRFPTTGEGGHGHHTASAILALEAFDAAADPKRYPEQLQYVQTWQARRVFWNTFNFGTTNTTAPDQVQVDVGVFNPLLGKSYGEIAAESRSMHKSQGFGSAKTRGTSIEYFKFLKGDSAKTDLFENIDITWKRISGSEKIQAAISNALSQYNPAEPTKSIATLADLYKQIQALPEKDLTAGYWKRQKLKEVETLLLNSAGLWLEATTADYTGIPGRPVDITAQIISRGTNGIKLNKVAYLGQSDTSLSLDLKVNELYTFKRKELLSAALFYSNPYWLNEAHTPGSFIVRNQLLVGRPENEPAGKVTFHLEINGVNLEIERRVIYKSTDPVKGEFYRPFEVLPPATVNVADKAIMFEEPKSKKVQFTIRANTDSISGTLEVKTPAGWTVAITDAKFNLKNKGAETVIEATITPGKGAKPGKLTAALKINGASYGKSIKRIEYDHIPPQFMLTDAEATLVPFELKKAGTNIGYIEGAGDDVPASLRQVGYTVTILTNDLIAKSDLSTYDAIVTGVRAYNTNDWLQGHYEKLMEYVNQGGNLVVQYNTNNRIGPIVAKIAPDTFNITRDRVTDENAEVHFVNPKHSALNYPNAITQDDFSGWIQERGIYFANNWDKNYETVLSMNDPGEKANEGSLIIGKYSKGNFVYTGLVFFRELPAGVPGAYRLFANLLSLPENKL
jgi:LmbE family N-acetylglucosaminyl deacetylase